MNFFITYLKQHKLNIFAFLCCIIIFAIIFMLYHLPLKSVLYPALLCILLLSVLTAIDFRKALQKHKKLLEIEKLTVDMITSLTEIQSIDDEDYQNIIFKIKDEYLSLQTNMTNNYNDMIDYYTVWVHQIKTPISSMRLTLQNEDTALSRKLSAELFRIEQYVEMVLVFLRLDMSATDYVIKKYDLDTIIKHAVKKFKGEFIGRKIKLVYEPICQNVITDEKWFSFCIEQILSNALKYTHDGCIKIYMKEPKILCIEDTGIGIAPEDLPRIFEKGYTGYNGRSDKKASGIGLYLCKRICGKLGLSVTAKSTLDVGTIIYINLEQNELEIE